MVGTCPECGAELRLENPELGELVVCEDCGAELEVVGLDPLSRARPGGGGRLGRVIPPHAGLGRRGGPGGATPCRPAPLAGPGALFPGG